MRYVDLLIVGHGLAGSLLAWELTQRGCSVLIVDNGAVNASNVAAGLVNPVTGMRLVKSRHLNVLFDSARAFYQRLEEFFGHTFFINKPMLRILQNENELQAAQKRLSQADYRPWLNRLYDGYPGLVSPYGVLGQRQTGYLITTRLLNCLQNYFIERQDLVFAKFVYTELALNGTTAWNHIRCQHVVFCEGYRLTANPFFNWLPLQPVKGETLTLRHTGTLPAALQDKYILNYGHWLLSVDDTTFRTGATFDWKTLDTNITEQAREELLAAMVKYVPDMEVAKVSGQQVGIRPTSPDREPMIGQHPEHKQLFVFNGFGTKGSLQIPYYSQRLADHLLNKRPLPEHTVIQRFYG